jgi:hypothetical protein
MALGEFLAYRTEWRTEEEWTVAGCGARCGDVREARRPAPPPSAFPVDWRGSPPACSTDDAPLWKGRQSSSPRASHYSYYGQVRGLDVGEFTRARERNRVRMGTRRAAKLGVRVPLTNEQWLDKLKLWAYSWAYCLRAYEQLDHIMPLHRGGEHKWSNVRPRASGVTRPSGRTTCAGRWCYRGGTPRSSNGW